MRRIAVVLCSAALLSGCALPLPFQVASWFLDGASVLATDKTIADHGLSLVAGQDCSIWRGLRDGDVCRENANDTFAIAMAAPVVEVAGLAAPRLFPPIDGPFLKVE